MISKREEFEWQLSNQDLPPKIVLEDTLTEALGKGQVLSGPFKGMKYSANRAVCSAYYPKILGSYESELHAIIDSFIKNEYSEVIDIGCAEGYYAVGLALKISSAEIFAFDTNYEARQLCYEMATENKVQNRIHIAGLCSPETLKKFPFTKRGLIVSDCEGFEAALFTSESIMNLMNCDMIIETHDWWDITISDKLRDVFSKTHHIQVIKSVDDIEKAKTYSSAVTQNASLRVKQQMFSEQRPGIMEWIICTPK